MPCPASSTSISAHEVCKNDRFDYKFGLNEQLDHTPHSGDRGPVTHFYAIAKFRDGGHHFENALCDILYMQRLVRPGGLVIVDDAWMPAIRAAAAYFESNLGLTREEHADLPAAKRFIVLRTPEKPVKRAWDHFAEFR